ncbi:MAG: hypothetical protein U1D35_11680 [Paracoccaceae bacterium]|nr:hypothetical protein [Paracoccaceae bacterium]
MKHANLALALILASPALAEDPQVVAAKATLHGGAWTFDVTLAHPDTGWDHYADAWEILAPDGSRLGIRDLAHPHEAEQPFTRSLAGVIIPEGIQHVLIHPRCTVDGWAGASYTLTLPR